MPFHQYFRRSTGYSNTSSNVPGVQRRDFKLKGFLTIKVRTVNNVFCCRPHTGAARLRRPAWRRPEMDRRLSRLADAVLQPGFVGTEPPDWVRRRLAEGLGSVVLYARNIVDPEQVAALTAALTAESPDVLIAIDEEAGDVTRVEAHRGSSRPGNLALGAADDVDLTAAVARHLGEELARARHHAELRPGRRRQLQPEQPGDRRTRIRRRAGSRRPAHRGLDPRPAVGRRGRLRQALPRARRHRRRLAPRRADDPGRPGPRWTPASCRPFGPRSTPASRRS